MKPNWAQYIKPDNSIGQIIVSDVTNIRKQTDILGPVVRKVDNAIHCINLYPVDNAILPKSN